MDFRKYLEEQAPEDRLDVAIMLLEGLTGSQTHKVFAIMHKYGLTRTEATIVAYMHEAYPRTLSKDQLFMNIYALDGRPSNIKIIDIYICKIRQKAPSIVIETVWGIGYKLVEKLDIVESNTVDPEYFKNKVVTPKGRVVVSSRASIDNPWTKEQEMDLIRMKENGSDLWVIAEELGRSERACLEHYNKLKKQKKESRNRSGL